ncbi:unnamed protein product [Microthlaspi erraticum]|uniref:Uncharacterized protein n=1 Tax=Microthlaspi erraticum TaxID=1685480 RepID=A0A6D2IDQ1_9BRAS|nr:unnamed protein product [Microthlaspi erraticum]
MLSHDSIGLVVTHSGWIEWYVIPWDETEGFFTKEIVAKSLRLVMEDEEGKVYRENVKEMKGVFEDMDRQDRYVHSFVDYLVANR